MGTEATTQSVTSPTFFKMASKFNVTANGSYTLNVKTMNAPMNFAVFMKAPKEKKAQGAAQEQAPGQAIPQAQPPQGQPQGQLPQGQTTQGLNFTTAQANTQGEVKAASGAAAPVPVTAQD